MDIREALKKLASKYSKQLDFGDTRKRLQRGYFGIYGLDKLTGGYPFGKVIMIWGKQSTGKSTTMARLTAEAQRTCRFCKFPLDICSCKDKQHHNVLFVDAEDKYDSMWFERHGVNIDDSRFSILNTSAGMETVFDFIRDAALDGALDIVIVDTWEALVPEKEILESVADYNIGLKARQSNKFLRLWTTTCQKVKKEYGTAPTLIIVNQRRASMSLYSSDVKPGGLGLEYAPSLILKYVSRQEKKEGSGLNKIISKITVSVYVEKSKTCLEGRVGAFDMYLKNTRDYSIGDTDDVFLMFKDLQDLEILHIDPKTKSVKLNNDDKLLQLIALFKKPHEFSSKKEFKETLERDYTFWYILRDYMIWKERSLVLREKGI